MSVVIELDEKIIAEVDIFAKDFKKTPEQYINDALQKSFEEARKKSEMSEKDRRFIESYKRIPQQPEEYEIWEDEQVWENE
jgi:predicted transcriptional regulator